MTVGSVAGLADQTHSRTFHTLDALRGVAALAVLLYHAAFIYHIATPAEGQLAVDLFFVMSGFIVAHRYEPDLRRGMGLAQFVRVRLIRLYPLFLLGMVIGVSPAFVDEALGRSSDLHLGLIEAFPPALFMLPSRSAMPAINELYPINYVAWSLALELVINVLYAASFRVWTINRLCILLGVAFVGLVFCLLVIGRLDKGYAWRESYVGIARVLYGFPAGVLLSRLYDRRRFVFRLPWWTSIVLAIALFFVGSSAEKGVWELVAITIVIPLIVAIAIASEPPRGVHRLCAIAGLLSYPVYSLHAPFISLFLRGEGLAHLQINVQTGLEAVVFTILLTALCVAAQFLYDAPVRRFLLRRTADLPWRRSRLSPAAVAAATQNH